jgi:uncharacterized membrane protein YqiK
MDALLQSGWLHLAAGLVVAVVGMGLTFLGAMARFLKRPSPSEAIIRIGRSTTEVFIARATWIVPILHRATTLSLSTIGLTIRRAGHDALVSKDFISTNLSAEFYIRVEPNEDDVKKAARTIGIDEGHANSEAVRKKAQQLLEPKLVGALRAVAAQNDFLALHLNREHFALEVSKALREDLGRNGFTLESVTITELTQTPLSEMRADDIFGASGRETVTNTVVAKNIAMKRKVQEEAERTAEIQREQEIRVAEQGRMLREGKAQQEEAAVKAEIAQKEAIETRDLQRQSNIALERARKEQTEQAAEIHKAKAVEAARVEKERAIEAAQVDKAITLTLKARESAEAEAQKAAALALLEKATQEVETVQQVAQAERAKQVALVAADRQAQEQRMAADVQAYQSRQHADALAQAQKAEAEGRAEAARLEAQGQAEAVRIKAQAEADAARLQAEAITQLAQANREAGLKDAEVLQERARAANAKSREVMLQEVALKLIENAPALVRELVKPAEHIGEIKVLQVGGGATGMGQGASQHPVLGNALGPIARAIMETSAVMPVLQSVLKFSDVDALRSSLAQVIAPPASAPSPAAPPATDPRVLASALQASAQGDAGENSPRG